MPTFELTGSDGGTYQVNAPNEQAALEAFGAFQSGKTSSPGVVEDSAKSFGIGALEGAMGLAGAPFWLSQQAARLGTRLGSRLRQAAGLEPIPEEVLSQFDTPAPGTKEFNQGVIESATGPFYKPQSTAGEYAKTLGEFAASAPMVEGGLAAKLLQTAVPAVVTETAGQATRKIAPSLEPWVRGAAAVLSGGGMALLQRPATANQAVRQAVDSIDPRLADQAQALIDQAAQRGVRLSLDEALASVSGGRTPLTDTARVVANSPGGRPIMSEFYNARPEQVRQAGNAAIGELAPQQLDPVSTGMRVQSAARGEIDDTQAAINAATRPAYKAAEGVRVDPGDFQALQADPLFAQMLREVRGDPALNRTIANLPDDAVGVVDLVQRRMREAAENARTPGQATTSNLRAANLDDARTPAVQAAEAATGGAQGPYAVAREAQTHLRQTELEPLQRGPMGDLAGKEQVMDQARALLPNQPAAGIDATVSQTVRRIVARDAPAAENLVRIYAQTVFDEATQSLKSGANIDGGAKFASVIIGNPQQARNLEAAVRALPNGHVRWEGFRRFLDEMEATGFRPETGSRTAFNERDLQQLTKNGLISQAVETVKSAGTNLPARLKEASEQWALGKNTEQLARILTDPQAGRLLGQILREPAGSTKAKAIAARLTYMGNSEISRNSSSQP